LHFSSVIRFQTVHIVNACTNYNNQSTKLEQLISIISTNKDYEPQSTHKSRYAK